MLHRGTLRLCAPLDEIKEQHRRVLLRFVDAHAEPPKVPGAIRVDGAGREWTAICDAERIGQIPGESIVENRPATLDEIFVAQSEAAPLRAVN